MLRRVCGRSYARSSPLAAGNRIFAAAAPICVAQMCCFATPDPVKRRRLRKLCSYGATGNPLRGRQMDSYAFEQRIRLVGADNVRHQIAWPLAARDGNGAASGLTFDPATTVVADFVTRAEIDMHSLARPHPMPIFAADEAQRSLEIDYEMRRRLQNQCDACAITVPLPPSSASTVDREVANVILVLEPDVRGPEYLQSESQVELITAFRNVLMEFFELNCPAAKSNAAYSLDVFTDPPKYPNLRLPAMSHELHGGKLDLSIDKVHQRALIQAFHRSSRELKDWFTVHGAALSVELFVPLPLLPSFERAFREEAWPTPKSALLPERRLMYCEMQMPRVLLEEAPGFVGQRKEIEALALPFEERSKVLAQIEASKAAESESDSDGTAERKTLLIELSAGDVTITSGSVQQSKVVGGQSSLFQ